MLPQCVRFIGLTYLTTTFMGAVAAGGDADKEAVHRFKVTVESALEMHLGDQKNSMSADSQFTYGWARKGKERVLSFDALLVKASAGGKQMMNVFMSRSEFSVTEGGKTLKGPIDEAPDKMRSMIKECLGVPICKLEVDENGREVKRTVLAGPGAKSMLDHGMIANGTIFHAPFPRNKDEWEADAEFSLGNGGYTRGKLKYVKKPGGKGGQRVEVTGTLGNESFKQPGSPLTLINARHVVRGEQTHDPVLGEWTSGKLNLELSMKVNHGDKEVGNAKGTMVVTFERLPK